MIFASRVVGRPATVYFVLWAIIAESAVFAGDIQAFGAVLKGFEKTLLS